MSKIVSVTAREILDSRGNPTVEADVVTDSGHIGRAAAPSARSAERASERDAASEARLAAADEVRLRRQLAQRAQRRAARATLARGRRRGRCKGVGRLRDGAAEHAARLSTGVDGHRPLLF